MSFLQKLRPIPVIIFVGSFAALPIYVTTFAVGADVGGGQVWLWGGGVRLALMFADWSRFGNTAAFGSGHVAAINGLGNLIYLLGVSGSLALAVDQIGRFIQRKQLRDQPDSPNQGLV